MRDSSVSRASSRPDIRAYRVPYAGSGAAPTYLLLHGMSLSHREYTGLARILSQTGHVLAFDLPGFGSTVKPDGPITVEEYATLIARELVERNVSPVIVVGHSMGAQFAIGLARRQPGAVSHVVLIAPVVDARHRTLRAQGWGLLRDSLREPPATQIMVMHDFYRCGVRWFLNAATAMRDYPTHRKILDLAHPLLVIRGDGDPIAKADWCDWLRRQVSGAELVTVSGRRHNVVHSDPAAIAAAMWAFEGGQRTASEAGTTLEANEQVGHQREAH